MKNPDVIVVGAGLIGAAAAYECAKSGAQVTLFDKHSIGAGASGNSAAMLELQIDAYRGEPFYSLAKASHDLFPGLVQNLTSETGIDTGYEPCSIAQVALTAEEAVSLENECRRQSELGLRAQWLTPAEVADRVPELTKNIFGAALFLDDGNINGRSFLRAYCKGAEKHGAQIHTDSGEAKLLIEKGQVTGVEVKGTLYRAPKIIVAAGAWVDQLLAPLAIQLKISPVRGQLVVFDTPQRILPFPIYTKSGGYLTPKKEGVTLAGSTIEHVGFDTSPTTEGRETILNLVRRLYPSLLDFPIRTITAGLRPQSPDHLPLLGSLPDHPNVFIASGHYRNGVLLAPITGRLAADFVMGRPPSIPIESFSPQRLFTQR